MATSSDVSLRAAKRISEFWKPQIIQAVPALLAGIAVGVLLSLYIALPPVLRSVDYMSQTAYDRGVEDGIKSQDWKVLALKDRKYTTKLCRAWWFEVDPVEKGKK